MDWFQIDLDDRKNIWTPTLYLGNAEHIQKSGSFGEESLIYLWYRSSTHMMHYSEIFKANVQCGMSFENFPFDSHTCPLTCFNPEKALRSLEFLPPLLENRKGEALKNLQIENHGLNFDITVKSVAAGVTEIRGYSYSTTGLLFMFRRNKVSTIITGYYLPSGMYSFLSGLSFSIPKEQVSSFEIYF